jgi:NAD dependent epimerase/dehydratase
VVSYASNQSFYVEFYQVKKIIVTGAGGFIGSHLTELCVQQGYQVKALIHYNSKNSWGWLDRSPCKNDVEIISGDIRDFDCVLRAIKGVDSIFHLAALIGIPYSYVSPLAYIRTNVEGTYNVLEAARLSEVSNILITSTSETYGTARYVPMDESHPLQAQSPYSATKIAADQLALSYYRSFHLPVKIVRPFNTYGPRQSARAVIPTVITQVLAGAKKINLGNVDPTRDFTYVLDTVRGFFEIERADGLFGEVTNIGMNDEISVRDLVALISNQIGSPVEIEEDTSRVRVKNSEVERLHCDNRKMIEHTAWRPQYNLEKGIAETIEWLKAHLDLYKPDLYNV